MLDYRRPGPAFAAPSRDHRQPAEVRLIWGCDSKDKVIIFLLLSQGNLTLCRHHRQAHTVPGWRHVAGEGQGGLKPKAQPQWQGGGRCTQALPHPAHLAQTLLMLLWEWAQSQLDWSIYDSPSLGGLSLLLLNLD